MLYVPNINNNNCVVVVNSETIRVYERQPVFNESINYIDYYVNSHYISKSGSEEFSRYQNLPTCVQKNILTSSVEYRNDFNDILTIFLILTIIIVVIPTKIVFRLFRRLR